ncbi:MAG: hypothetical protein ACP5N1_02825 [Candidatus Woesearchaeota archaeon]
MKYEENNSGWIKKQKDKNILKDNYAYETRITSLKRLISSDLPTYNYVFLSYNEFMQYTHIKQYYKTKIVVRACPNDETKYQRYTEIGKSYRYVKDILEQKISKELRDKYTIVINEYDPAKYCGVIISKPDILLIELVSEPNLENLCHGKTIPWSATFEQEKLQGYKKMKYHNVKDQKIKQILWDIVKKISNNNIENYYNITPRLGYFEFVISKKTKKLKFIDYKL